MSAASYPGSVSRDYPGLGLPLRHHPQDEPHYPIGAHGSNHGSICEPLFVRELAMMVVMEKLTDKPDWHKKVFDNEIIAKWRKEALAIPDDDFWQLAISGKLMRWRNGEVHLRDGASRIKRPDGIFNENAFDCCIKELQSKAKYFDKTGIVPTLDAHASVAKSDNLVDPKLQNALREAFDRLKADSAASIDWHPNSNDMVQDLVHPSMYPLVYGRSQVFKEECVGLKDAISKWSGKGNVIAKDDWKWDEDDDDDDDDDDSEEEDEYGSGVGSGKLPPEYWSGTYQWLPANVAFKADGGVEFTSYINNLHPLKYPGIYRTIEDLIKTSLPMWDQCLVLQKDYRKPEGAGRDQHRIGLPSSLDDEDEDNWTPRKEECAEIQVSERELSDKGWDSEYYESERIVDFKWQVLRKPLLPEARYTDIDYSPKDGKRLIDRFNKSGLQIIVKLASIELTPEKPSFPAGGWHVEGQMNEHICATALYYLDSDNITSSSLSFRMQTSSYLSSEEKYEVGQDSYSWMESAFGTCLGGGSDPCLQNYGSVETRQGRLLAFPNVLQHRVSPFELIDKTKPGHRRFIALWLVDPTLRIISTANVPPQQMSWYAESVLGDNDASRKESLDKLPPELMDLLQKHCVPSDGKPNQADAQENPKLPEELMDMVRNYFSKDRGQIPMSVEEANEHRLKLMGERGAFRDTAERWWRQHAYSFCEH